MQNYEILERYAAEEKRKAYADPPLSLEKLHNWHLIYNERRKDVDFQPVFAIYTIKKKREKAWYLGVF